MYVTLSDVLFITAMDKCAVSKLINGVDTIKIEDSVNTRPGKLYKVELLLFLYSFFILPLAPKLSDHVHV